MIAAVRPTIAFASGAVAIPDSLSIMHVLAPGIVGGLESVVTQLAAGLRDRGERVQVLAVVEDGAPHPFVESLRERRVPVQAIVAPGRAYLRERAAIADHCRRERPDVVHTHGYRADLIAGGVARGQEIATVSTVHGFTGGDWRNRLYQRLQRRALRRADAVIAVSHPLRGELVAAGLPADRLHLLPNAFRAGATPVSRQAAREGLGIPADAYRIGFVGRLSREKGADVLLRALRHVERRAVSLSVLGDGPELASLRALAADLEVADRVTFHGTRPAAGTLLRAFDALVVSSHTEGTPIVVLEAMHAGVPIIATSVGGIPDMLAGDDARLVPAGDPIALAAAITIVHDDPAFATSRALTAKHRLARQFALDPWLERHLALYRAVRRATSRRP